MEIFGLNYKDNNEEAKNFINDLGNPFVKIGSDIKGGKGGGGRLDFAQAGGILKDKIDVAIDKIKSLI